MHRTILTIIHRTLCRNSLQVALFYPRPYTYFSRGKLGYLVARIAAASTLTAHTNAIEANLLDPVAPAPSSSFIFPISSSPLALAFISVSVYFSVLYMSTATDFVTPRMKINKKTLFFIEFQAFNFDVYEDKDEN